MVRIVDDRNTVSQELPTLPFVTEAGGNKYLYFQDVNDDIRCLHLELGMEQMGKFSSIQDAVENFGLTERIVEIELHIIK
jgi:hypothetical protein